MTDSGSTFQEEFFKKHDYYKVITLLLQKGEPVEIMLTGHCMKPFLHEGDLITVKPVRAQALACGDVAVYHINGRLKAHRFLRFVTIDGIRHIITKSDRRYGYDPPVPLSTFLGVITQVKKGDRTMNYESRNWRSINFLLGKLSPSISVIERPIVFLLRLPKRAARKLYRTVLS
jgi:hypothetical protein